MVNINYDINNALFPFDFAIQHFKAMPQEVEWEGWTVHLILGVLELIFPINYIIAVFERIIATEQQRIAAAQQVSKAQRDLLKATVAGLLKDLQFGLATQLRTLDDDIQALASTGIHTVEDLRVLELLEWDETLQQMMISQDEFSTLFLRLPRVEVDDSFLRQELADLKRFSKMFEGQLDQPAMEKMRGDLNTIKATLEAHCKAVDDPSNKYPKGYGCARWWTINLRFVNIDLNKAVHNWDVQELTSIVGEMQEEETARQQALNDYRVCEPELDRFKEYVKTVTSHIISVNALIDAQFKKDQYEDAQAQMVQDLRESYQQQLGPLEKIGKDLEGDCPCPFSDFARVLKALQSYSKLESIILLRFYINQTNVTSAWEILDQQGAKGLAAYRQSHEGVTVYDLFKLGIA